MTSSSLSHSRAREAIELVERSSDKPAKWQHSLTEAYQQEYGHIILNLPAVRKAFPHVVSLLI